MYAARRDWIFHEVQTHLRQWNCRLCDHEAFQQEDALGKHISTQHADRIKPTQIPAMLRISESKLKESTIHRCEFCYLEDSVVNLLDHMAGHMEQLALFTLPTGDDDEEYLWGSEDDLSSDNGSPTQTEDLKDNRDDIEWDDKMEHEEDEVLRSLTSGSFSNSALRRESRRLPHELCH